MLETIREFATEQLAASGEAELVERAFEEFLIAHAEAAEEGLTGSRSAALVRPPRGGAR